MIITLLGMVEDPAHIHNNVTITEHCWVTGSEEGK